MKIFAPQKNERKNFEKEAIIELNRHDWKDGCFYYIYAKTNKIF